MDDTTQRRVVCAAIRADDGTLLLGIRHYSRDMHEQIVQRADGHKFRNRLDEDQGFVDQHGEFMGREEAYSVAMRADQIAHPEKCGKGLRLDDWGQQIPRLYSEGLY